MNSELDFADIFARIAQLEEVYEELNASINRTMLQTGLRCLPGCRSCCGRLLRTSRFLSLSFFRSL